MKPWFSSKRQVICVIAFAFCLFGWSGAGASVHQSGEESPICVNQPLFLTQAIASAHSGWMPGTVPAFSDFDGDKKIDVAMGRRIGDEFAIEIRLTSRPGSTILKSKHLLAGFKLVLIDINKDDDQDVIATDPFESRLLAVWLGDGKGGFTAVDHTRFAGDFGFATSPSCQRSTFLFHQDLLGDSPRPLCDKPHATFGDLVLELAGLVGFEAPRYLLRQDHPFLTLRSPPGYLPA